MTGHENLWMRPERPARGPRPSFSRAALAQAAIRIADAEGLEAISMRRLAADLGAGTMSLYRYVTSKDEVFDLMVDTVVGEYLPEDRRPPDDWVEGLRLLAWQARRTMLRHPWLAPLAAGRPQAGPNSARLTETALGMLDALGLSVDEMLTLVGAVFAYVNGYIQSELAEAEALRRSGLTLAQRLAQHLSYIQSLIATGNYPMLERMTKEGGREYMGTDDRFAYGLDRLLDGIAAGLPPRGGSEGPASSR
ncbi:TetR/AcrR family transcriptional regulator [Microbispora sp. NBRC 16548]|uniref:TetR/AcrR family transcriptional regulator n=1 Tax=Microbispora sp. NBRC 16548 TaxID=3030994 RepID=UPI00160864C2|nr:TetR/AcrR family transcriptional regulator [Microbispora sp. NBRC 16548]GLX03468.1 TetR family transcriptional regulator [Microbispora sp. NBRC 16548]